MLEPNIEDLLSQIDRSYVEKQYSTAEKLCNDAIALAPGNAQAYLMLSVISSRLGDLDRAIINSRKAIELAPTFPEASAQLAELLRSAGRLSEAIAVCKEFIDRVPSSGLAHSALGLCYFDQGLYDEAAALFQRAVALDPSRIKFRSNLATVYEKLGRKEESVRQRRKILQASPETQSAVQIGALLLAKGKDKEAVVAFRQAVELDNSSFEANLGLGAALAKIHETEEAADSFRRAIALKPQHGGAHEAFGETLEQLGEFEEAIKYLERALELEPKRASIYLRIVGAKTICEEDSPLIERIEQLLQRNDLGFPGQIALHYALGKACDDLGRFEEALSHLDEATQITVAHPSPADRRFSEAEANAVFDFNAKTFTPEFFAHFSSLSLDSDLPIFIVGSPRSGTTLLEQILTGHPEIGSSGEQLFWIKRGNEALAALRKNPAHAREIAEEYRQLLRSFGPKKRRVIDKMPMNYGAIGIIHTLFPNARFIHSRRNPVDTCLSLYMNAHAINPPPFGRTRKEIVNGYQCYLRTMEYWRATMPTDRFMEIDYEDVVADREATARRIVAFCGLEWRDANVEHESNTRKVNTPSMWQVRQPIYTTSVERWRRYEPWLGEFRRLLPEQT